MKGIKSIDFLVQAVGEGIVNTNGACKDLVMPHLNGGEKVNNHKVPKIRNLNPTMIKDANDFNGNHEIFVSNNCIRNKIFEEGQNIGEVNNTNVLNVLTNFLGLGRGYMSTSKDSMSAVRKSPLFITDFVAMTGLRFEQFSNSKGLDKNKLFSEHRPMGEVHYQAKGSISVEDLRFIPLDGRYTRSAYKSLISEVEMEKIRSMMTENLRSLALSLNEMPAEQKSKLKMESDFDPEEINVESSNNYVRRLPYKATVSYEGEAGLMLNDKAIDVVVLEFLRRISNLFITRSRGYLRVNSIAFDYNDGSAMRIEDNREHACEIRDKAYWVYYEDKEMTEKEYQEKTERQIKIEQERRGNSTVTPANSGNVNNAS